MLLSADDVTERLGKSREYWIRQARAKKIPHRRIGRTISWTPEDVDAIVADAYQTPTDPLGSLIKRRR